MKMPGNMQAMMQQAQKMQQKMQEEIAQIRVEASAGGGNGAPDSDDEVIEDAEIVDEEAKTS